MIDSHFPLAPFWALSSLVNEVSAPQGELVSLERIEGKTGRLLQGEGESNANGRQIRKDDVLFGKLRPYLAKYWLADRPGTAQGDIHVYRPTLRTDPRFLAYIVGSDYFTGLADTSSTGSKMPRVEWPKVAQFRVPFPPRRTQRAIADYLDRETAEIDAMTVDLAKMEALLTERRDATLARLLSEAEQSGMQIRNVRVKFLCNIGTGHGDTQDASDGGAYPFYVRSPNVLRSSEWDIQGPAVLTAGDGVGVGRVFHYAEGKMKVHQRVYALTNFRNVNPRFFYEAFRQYFPETVLYGGASSTVSSLRMHMLADLNLPIPPLEEQCRITAEIDRETAEIDAMLADITELRDLLAERRAALIAAAVTGQIDIPTAEETPHA